jgi:hypothetical protein
MATAVVLMAVACVPVAEPPQPQTDSDGDRLADVVETGTGVYVGASNTGTDPLVADTDDDGIADGDEVLGTADGLDLPAMGTNPLKKDLIAEFDWFDDNAQAEQCAAHSHRPTAAVIDVVIDAFAAGRVSNPDGSTGVNFIADHGQGGAFTGGNFIADDDGLIDGIDEPGYDALKAEHFAANRMGYVRYVLDPHHFTTSQGSTGQAERNGADVIVSMGCRVTDDATFWANTIMHELGHSLGLAHGGGDEINWKPNYNSVMNYAYQRPGIDTNCDAQGDGVTDFSDGTLPALDEFNLYEVDGICGPGGPGVDWNWNEVIDTEVQATSINGDEVGDVLHDHDDWAAVNLSSGLAPSENQRRAAPELITEELHTDELHDR